MSTDLLNRYAELQEQLEELKAEARRFCQDTDKPLALRWEVWTTLKVGTIYSTLVHWRDFDAAHGTEFETMFNTGVFRNEVIDLVLRITGQEADLIGGWAYDWVTEERLDAFKEHLIEIGIAGYEVDW